MPGSPGREGPAGPVGPRGLPGGAGKRGKRGDAGVKIFSSYFFFVTILKIVLRCNSVSAV